MTDTGALGWAVVFWASAALLAYVYAGYPAIAWLRARRRPRALWRGRARPAVTVLVVAYNEADRIGRRIENLLAQDYPRDKLEIVIASDGSTDATAEVARGYAAEGVVVVAFEARRGKPAVLDELIPRARGEIVVLADARQRFEPRTVRALAEAFAQPAVGAVSGELILTDGSEGTAVGRGVGFYWRYEKWIRRNESCLDSTVGATGAVYAIRRDLFAPIPPDTVLDDVLIPLRIVRGGYRVVFEPGARAWDQVAPTPAHEMGRKVRTLAGNFQLFWRERWLVDPGQNRIWLATVSHKALRLAGPVLYAGALVASLALAADPLYRLAFAAQVAFYLAAVAGHFLPRAGYRSPLFSVPYVLCLLNWATIVGFFRFAAGRQDARWERPRA